MLVFDPDVPFPLLEAGTASYQEAQEHSALVDAWLGFDVEKVEAVVSQEYEVRPERQYWIGLPSRTLQTPYTEFRKILELVSPKSGQTVVDLGAGYGRMAFVIERHHPEVRFIGFEVVSPRVMEGLRVFETHGMRNHSLVQADLSDPKFIIPEAAVYFIYDFGSRTAIERCLGELQNQALRKPGTSIIVVGRGRSSRDAIERHHPWLSQVIEPEHFEHYSIYRSGIHLHDE